MISIDGPGFGFPHLDFRLAVSVLGIADGTREAEKHPGVRD